MMAAASAGVTKRGEGGKKTKPTQSAPASAAASSAAGSLIPQILTRGGLDGLSVAARG